MDYGLQDPRGFFLILTSPSIVESKSIVSEFNGDLQSDALVMVKFLKEKLLKESLFSISHGIGECGAFNPEIHTKEQFWKQIGHLSNLINLPDNFEVVIYYCGHGVQTDRKSVV